MKRIDKTYRESVPGTTTGESSVSRRETGVAIRQSAVAVSVHDADGVLAKFRELIGSISTRMSPASWHVPAIISAAPQSEDSSRPKKNTWVFDDLAQGMDFLEKMMKNETWYGLDATRQADYLYILKHGVSAAISKKQRNSEESIGKLFQRLGSELSKSFDSAFRVLTKKQRDFLDSYLDEKTLKHHNECGGWNRNLIALTDEFIDNAARANAVDISDGVREIEGFGHIDAGDIAVYLHHRMIVHKEEGKRQRKLERRLDLTIGLIGAIHPGMRGVIDFFREDKISYSVITDPEAEPSSYTSRSLLQAVFADRMSANEIRIREGAHLDEVAHELVHSVPQGKLPKSFRISDTLPEIHQNDDFVVLKSAIERHDNAQEASAFAAMAALRNRLRAFGAGTPPWGSFNGLIRLARERGAQGVYEELIANAPAYRAQGIGNAWKAGLLLKARTLSREQWGRTYWVRNARGWGVRIADNAESVDGPRVASIDLDKLFERAMGEDPMNTLRGLEMALGDLSLGGLDYAPMAGLFPRLSLIDAPKDLPLEGLAGGRRLDPQDTSHRVALLYAHDRIWRRLGQDDIARFEALLVAAEHADADDARRLLMEAYGVVQKQQELRLFGGAAVMFCRLGATLIRRGYRVEGERYLRDVATYLTRVDEIVKSTNEDHKILAFEDSGLKLLEPLVGEFISTGTERFISGALTAISMAISQLQVPFDSTFSFFFAEGHLIRILSRIHAEGTINDEEKDKIVKSIVYFLEEKFDAMPDHYVEDDNVFGIHELLMDDPHSPRIASSYFDFVTRAESDFDSLLLNIMGLTLGGAPITEAFAEKIVSAFTSGLPAYQSEYEDKVRPFRFASRYTLGAVQFLDHILGKEMSPSRSSEDVEDEDDIRMRSEVIKLTIAAFFQSRPERVFQEYASDLLKNCGRMNGVFLIEESYGAFAALKDFFGAIITPDFPHAEALYQLSRSARGEDEDHLSFEFSDIFALALVREAHAFPERAGELLGQALKAVRRTEPFVRFENYPIVLAKINVLSELRDAFVTILGDVKSAERVHKLLISDYAEDFFRSVTKQQESVKAYLKGLKNGDKEKLLTEHPYLSSIEHEDFSHFSTVAMNARFDVLKARHFYLSGQTKKADALFDKVIGLVGEDISQRRKNFTLGHILRMIASISSVDSARDKTARLCSVAVQALALARGASWRIHAPGDSSEGIHRGVEIWRDTRRKGAAGIIRNHYEEIRNNDEIDRLQGREVEIQSRYRLADSQMDLSNIGAIAQRGLSDSVADFIGIVEGSVLSHDRKEDIYVALVEEMIPSRHEHWPELLEAAPESLEPFNKLMEGNRYPRLEQTVLKNLARAAGKVEFDPQRPAQNSGVSIALTQIVRMILSRNPEFASPRSVPKILALSKDDELIAHLRHLFPQAFETRIAEEGDASRLDAFPYTLTDIITGHYDRNETLSGLDNLLNTYAMPGLDVGPSESGMALKIARTLLKNDISENKSESPILRKIAGWIDKTLIPSSSHDESAAVVRALVVPHDRDEALAMLDFGRGLLARAAHGKEIHPELEFCALSIVNMAGAMGDHAFNKYLLDSPLWNASERSDYLAHVLEFSRFDSEKIGPPNDLIWQLFLTNTARDQGLGDEFFSIYERFSRWKMGGDVLNGSLSRPIDILLYYELHVKNGSKSRVEGDSKQKRIPTFDEFSDLIMRHTGMRGYHHQYGFVGVWEEMSKHFVDPYKDGDLMDRPSQLHDDLKRLKGVYREAEKQVTFTRFNIPAVFRELPPAIRYAVAKFFTDLPLGEREDILKDFDVSGLGQEEAFKLFLEKTGNEKLGQFLSLLKGVVPEGFRRVFTSLREDVRGSSVEEVARELRLIYGPEYTKLLPQFDFSRLKSGTVGEIYRARLRVGGDERPVLVKMLTHARRQKIERNLERLGNVASDLTKNGSQLDLRFDPVELVGEFSRTMHEEMDFKQEIENARALSAILPSGISVPVYYETESRGNILIMSEISGVTFNRVIDVDIKRAVAEKLGAMLARHIFVEGLFHEDLHDRNIFVDGMDIGLIDFGRLGRLTARNREAFLVFAVALVTGDFENISKALSSLIKHAKPWASRYALERELKKAVAGITINDMVGAADGLFAAAARAGYAVSSEYMQTVKALVTLESAVREDERFRNFSMAKYIVEVIPEAATRVEEERAAAEESTRVRRAKKDSGSGTPSSPVSPPSSSSSPPISTPTAKADTAPTDPSRLAWTLDPIQGADFYAHTTAVEVSSGVASFDPPAGSMMSSAVSSSPTISGAMPFGVPSTVLLNGARMIIGR